MAHRAGRLEHDGEIVGVDAQHHVAAVGHQAERTLHGGEDDVVIFAGSQGELDSFGVRLAREHGLLFFYRADCPHCRAMAPILKAFASTQGFEVLAVRLDAPATGTAALRNF